jgi:signal transduction histidine kinase
MCVFGASAALLLWFIYASTTGFMDRQTDETINAEIRGLAEQYSQQGLTGLVRVIKFRVAEDKTGGSVYLLTNWKFVPLAGNLPEWPGFSETQDGWLTLNLDKPESGRKGETRIRYFLLPGNYHLLVGRDVSERNKLQGMIIDSLGWAFFITLALGVIGGLFISRGMLGRLDVVNKAIREIINGDLTRRIPVRGPGDEFDRLAGNLNDMLDQIGLLMEGVRQVSDNIAHDLRGPLTRIRGGLEMSLRSVKTPEEYREVMEQAMVEIDNLLATFNALLTIAQAEAGSRREDFKDVDVALLAQEAAELYEPLAEEKGITFTVELVPELYVPGNRHLLAQALANLLDNAIKYTPEGGRVGVALVRGEGGPILSVSDSGPGVPAEAREKVVERFHRLEESRNTPGSGLGLSLVAAVAKLHHAKLVFGDNAPGLTASLVFGG